MSNRVWTIYVLKDRATGEVRYVGKTCQLVAVRHYAHLSLSFRVKQPSPFHEWMMSAIVDAAPLCVCQSERDAYDREVQEIRSHAQRGERIFNIHHNHVRQSAPAQDAAA